MTSWRSCHASILVPPDLAGYPSSGSFPGSKMWLVMFLPTSVLTGFFSLLAPPCLELWLLSLFLREDFPGSGEECIWLWGRDVSL